MNLQIWIWLMIGITFSLYIGIAIWSKAGSTKEFYVAGSGVSPIANGMATAADWMSAASFISMAGLISFMGYDGSVYLVLNLIITIPEPPLPYNLESKRTLPP